MNVEALCETIGALDALAGFLGAAVAVANQDGSLRMPRIVSALWVGTVSAVYGAPVLAEWQNLTKAAEYMCAAMIGLTAQTHIIPGILSAAAVVSKLPSKWAKSKTKDL